MKREIVLLCLVVAVVGVIYGGGKWHWQKQIGKTQELVEYERSVREETKVKEPLERFQREGVTLSELKHAFSIEFEEAYLEYETAMTQLLDEAEQEYLSIISANDQFDQHEFISAYQTAFLAIENEWANAFWSQYEALQREMEAAGYYWDDAFEYELEYELRREQTTHTYLQALLKFGR